MPLTEPITPAEVKKAIKALSTGRASGPDDISGELYKALLESDDPTLPTLFSTMFNEMFTQGRYLPSLGEGLLCPLNKPNGKPATESNTRPITLLNSDRKIFSLIVLHRIKEKLENFITIGQSGARSGRNTSDLIWTYRWLTATVQRYKLRFQLLGLDLSKAFDCVDRSTLLTALQKILSDSEYRMVRVLLSSTKLQARIKGIRGQWFNTTTGIPQGDSLSPLLFTFYLELAFRHYKSQHNITDSANLMITHYVDDTDFLHRRPLSTPIIDPRQQIQDIKTSLRDFNLIVNDDKTEHIIITRESAPTLDNKKLGNTLSSELDIKARIRAADLAFGQLWKIWLNDRQLTNKPKLRIYRACIEPILTYNAHCLALPASKLRALDIAHRRHLRSILRIFYPATITNSLLYICSETEPLTITITQRRWRLFGHILRTPTLTPANRAMSQFYGINNDLPKNDRIPCYRGGQPTYLPTILHHDLKALNPPLKLKSTGDLAFLRGLAKRPDDDRTIWRDLTARITAANRAITYEKIKENEPPPTPPIARTPSSPQSRATRQDGGHRHRRYDIGVGFALTSDFDANEETDEPYPHDDSVHEYAAESVPADALESDIAPSTSVRWSCLCIVLTVFVCVYCSYFMHRQAHVDTLPVSA